MLYYNRIEINIEIDPAKSNNQQGMYDLPLVFL